MICTTISIGERSPLISLRSENFSKIRVLNPNDQRRHRINHSKAHRSIDIFKNCNIFISWNGLYSLFQFLDCTQFLDIVKFQSSIGPIKVNEINDSIKFSIKNKVPPQIVRISYCALSKNLIDISSLRHKLNGLLVLFVAINYHVEKFINWHFKCSSF